MQREIGAMQEIMLRGYGEFCNIKNDFVLSTGKSFSVKEFVEIDI